MELNLLVADQPGSEQKITVAEKVFNQKYNETLIHQAVVACQAHFRQNSKQTKNRSDVSGGGRKPWRQKGTGRARAGTIRSPIWRGGGMTFAIKERNYKQKLNKKMYAAAMRSIISELARSDRLVIVDSLQLAEPKTKEIVAKLKQYNISNALIVVDELDSNLLLASRNLHYIYLCEANHINPVDLIGFDKVLMTQDALKKVEEVLG